MTSVTEILLKLQININLTKTWMIVPDKRASRDETEQHPGHR